MFRRKKSANNPAPSPRAPRGRASQAGAPSTAAGGPDSPLARRFDSDDEPPTVDLAAAAASPARAASADDPQTQPLPVTGDKLARLISHDPTTGKCYLHPGAADRPITLGGEPVDAATELRPGDRIRIGDLEIVLQTVPELS